MWIIVFWKIIDEVALQYVSNHGQESQEHVGIQLHHAMEHQPERGCITTPTWVCVAMCIIVVWQRTHAISLLYVLNRGQEPVKIQLPHAMEHQFERGRYATPTWVCVAMWIIVVWKRTHAMTLQYVSDHGQKSQEHVGIQLPHAIEHQFEIGCITTPYWGYVAMWIIVVWKRTHAMTLKYVSNDGQKAQEHVGIQLPHATEH